MREEKVIYYKDELNDEFAGDDIVAKKIDDTYRYIRESFTGKLAHVFWYRVIATPLAFLYMKLHFHHKIVNRKILYRAKGQGYFVYGNHTHFLADALIPTLTNFPANVSVIVHPNNVSMPVLGRITPSLGALPLPDSVGAAKNFLHAIEHHIGKKRPVMIYPEAHIWPYYTDIRPFKDTSFRYPIQLHTPVFAMTNTYQKRRFSKNPRIVTYLDGPFYADRTLPVKKQREKLREEVYSAMKERAKNNSLVLVRYEKMSEESSGECYD